MSGLPSFEHVYMGSGRMGSDLIIYRAQYRGSIVTKVLTAHIFVRTGS